MDGWLEGGVGCQLDGGVGLLVRSSVVLSSALARRAASPLACARSRPFFREAATLTRARARASAASARPRPGRRRHPVWVGGWVGGGGSDPESALPLICSSARQPVRLSLRAATRSLKAGARAPASLPPGNQEASSAPSTNNSTTTIHACSPSTHTLASRGPQRRSAQPRNKIK